MSANRFGELFTITTFGESHGPALGVVVDGCPAGVPFDHDLLLHELRRRRPGSSDVVSAREEADEPEVLSGVHEGKTLGTPIAIVVRSRDARPEDYTQIARRPRPGHADDVWKAKFGHVDPRGGGRASGRETVARVMGGAVAHMLLAAVSPDTRVTGFARTIGPHSLTEEDVQAIPAGQVKFVDQFVARFPAPQQTTALEALLKEARDQGLSYGGLVELWVDGVPAGLGQPVFHKLKADLAAACLGVGAAIGIELGAGFEASRAEGSAFHQPSSGAPPYGGIRGGISTGERIVARIPFKPTASLLDTARRGRHDPCIVPRAIPVLEAMIWLVLADHFLWRQLDRSAELRC
ncbi:MAG: chorismate synthase [Planctomycetes bacterium]|nr:chorismate synthase [Planctomycetota bacterium]